MSATVPQIGKEQLATSRKNKLAVQTLVKMEEHALTLVIITLVFAVMVSKETTAKMMSTIVIPIHVTMVGSVSMEPTGSCVNALQDLLDPIVRLISMNVLRIHVGMEELVLMELESSNVLVRQEEVEDSAKVNLKLESN